MQEEGKFATSKLINANMNRNRISIQKKKTYLNSESASILSKSSINIPKRISKIQILPTHNTKSHIQILMLTKMKLLGAVTKEGGNNAMAANAGGSNSAKKEGRSAVQTRFQYAYGG